MSDTPYYGDPGSAPNNKFNAGPQAAKPRPRTSVPGEESSQGTVQNNNSVPSAPTNHHEVAQTHADSHVMRLRAAVADLPFGLSKIPHGIIAKNAKDYVAGGGQKSASVNPPN